MSCSELRSKLAEVGLLHEALEHGGHDEGVRHALALHGFQPRLGLELRQRDQRAPAQIAAPGWRSDRRCGRCRTERACLIRLTSGSAGLIVLTTYSERLGKVTPNALRQRGVPEGEDQRGRAALDRRRRTARRSRRPPQQLFVPEDARTPPLSRPMTCFAARRRPAANISRST